MNFDSVNWVGHRGWPAYYPENSLSGILAACEAGATGIELDVQLSADGVAVVLHDASLERTAGLSKQIFQLHADELQAVRIGETARLGERFAQEPLPTLAEVASALAQWPQVTVFVELKSETLAHFDEIYFIERVWQALNPIRHQVVIISFVLSVLRKVQQRQWCPVGWVLSAIDECSRRAVVAQAVDYLIADHKLLPAPEICLWAGPWQWFVYDVVDRELANECHRRGIHWQETWDIGLVKQF